LAEVVTGSVTGNVTADARMVIGATFNIVGSGVDVSPSAWVAGSRGSQVRRA
jgi:hypothetical protein